MFVDISKHLKDSDIKQTNSLNICDDYCRAKHFLHFPFYSLTK